MTMTHGTIEGDKPQVFRIGDKVRVRPDVAGRHLGVVFTVEKKLTKNLQLVRDDGARLRAAPHLLVAADSAVTTLQVNTLDLEPGLVTGTVVRYSADGNLYVITAEMAIGKYRMVRLGGDRGRYYTKVARGSLTVVDLKDILK